jgi:acyl dehydratase
MTITATESTISVQAKPYAAAAPLHNHGRAFATTHALATQARAVVDVATPDVSQRLAYQLRYYTAAARSLLCRHRLDLPPEPTIYRSEVRVSPGLQQQWHDLFHVRPNRPAFLTYFTTSGTCLFMRMLADLGINFRHLLHFSSEVHFAKDGRAPAGSGIHQQISGLISEVSMVGEDRIALVVDHESTTPSGHTVQHGRDTFVIGGLTPEVIDAVRPVARPASLDLHDLTRRPSRLNARADVERAHVEVGTDAGRRYGLVSGDLNLVHTTRTAARIFGFRGAFLQGLATANHVLADIARHVPDRLAAFQIIFARPLYLGQTVEIVRDHVSFEVLDQRRRVIAYGTYRTVA